MRWVQGKGEECRRRRNITKTHNQHQTHKITEAHDPKRRKVDEPR